jgi:hypothetical protein
MLRVVGDDQCLEPAMVLHPVGQRVAEEGDMITRIQLEPRPRR